MTVEIREPEPSPRYKKWQAAALWTISVGFLAVCIFVLFPLASRVNVVRLQWAGSAAAANTIVGQGSHGRYRVALYWDFPLIISYTAGLCAAGYLGRRVFWTHRMRAAARAG